MKIRREERPDLLRALRFDAGQADHANASFVTRGFLPIAEHLRALEPEVVLVVGDRGAGKTMLVRVAADEKLRSAALGSAPSVRMPGGRIEWLRGWPLERRGPDTRGWGAFAGTHPGDRSAMEAIWAACLLRSVRDQLADDEVASLREVLDVPGADVVACHDAFAAAGARPLVALDRLDARLEAADRWLFVAYDELDTVVTSGVDALRAVLGGLVGFWVQYSRRWSRLRAKLFLRTDFYRRFGEAAGADVVKLAANRVQLEWSDRNLYGALIKHFANADARLAEYVRSSGVPLDSSDGPFGLLPRLSAGEEAQPFVERLVGRFMGAGHRKGKSYTWILDHLRDGNRKLSPRSLVRLVEEAAAVELDRPRAQGVNLLHPTSLRSALDRVSEVHVEGAKGDVPWLHGLRERLRESREVPWIRRDLERLLARRFDEGWGGAPAEVHPPAANPRELVDHLLELGIFRERTEEKCDVPDLYLKGLGLVRRGGVGRR